MIEVGDLVVVVKPQFCCGATTRLGQYFVVQGIEELTTRCTQCGETKTGVVLHVGESTVLDIRRCRKVPPLQQLERQTTEEPIKEKEKAYGKTNGFTICS